MRMDNKGILQLMGLSKKELQMLVNEIRLVVDDIGVSHFGQEMFELNEAFMLVLTPRSRKIFIQKLISIAFLQGDEIYEDVNDYFEMLSGHGKPKEEDLEA